jgi:hypothetical protein
MHIRNDNVKSSGTCMIYRNYNNANRRTIDRNRKYKQHLSEQQQPEVIPTYRNNRWNITTLQAAKRHRAHADSFHKKDVRILHSETLQVIWRQERLKQRYFFFLHF